MKIVSIINQKGGVGKTTTVANLAAALAEMGQKVCAVDLDPQSHLTLHLGFEPGDNTPTVYDVLNEEVAFDQATVKVRENLHLVPATTDLAAAGTELVPKHHRNQILQKAVAASQQDYDFIIIDCPPALGLLTLNSLAASDEVIIPLQPHFLALQGVSKLLRTIELVHQRLNPKLQVGGVVFCMFEQVTRLARDVVSDVMKFFKSARSAGKPWSNAVVYHTAIRRNVKLAESPSFGQSIFEYDAKSNGAHDYLALAREFIEKHAPAETNQPPAQPTEQQNEFA